MMVILFFIQNPRLHPAGDERAPLDRLYASYRALCRGEHPPPKASSPALHCTLASFSSLSPPRLELLSLHPPITLVHGLFSEKLMLVSILHPTDPVQARGD